MSKNKRVYQCQECSSVRSQWQGQCADCGAWNSLIETRREHNAQVSRIGYAGQKHVVTALNEVQVRDVERISTGINELDRTLGGGIVPGAVILIGGDPGIGKSTLLLQIIAKLSEQFKTLYVTGEESLAQVSLRAKRLRCANAGVMLFSETSTEAIISTLDETKPSIAVIDSIQTLFSEALESAPGSVSQVRESAAKLVRYAKTNGIAIFLVGHVTKEGAIAGPRVLEHMVDTVLYFESNKDARIRILRAVKNRFGAVNEIGVFSMTEQGLRGVSNPSSIFLSPVEQASGSVVTVTWEGTRPLLVEIQALVDASKSEHSRRMAIGLDAQRLNLVMAVMSRHQHVRFSQHDVFVNVVGGLEITETASDLAMVYALLHSAQQKYMKEKTIIFGEVGLSGEIRPVSFGVERLKEAQKLGFERAIIPKRNLPKESFKNLDIVPLSFLSEIVL